MNRVLLRGVISHRTMSVSDSQRFTVVCDEDRHHVQCLIYKDCPGIENVLLAEHVEIKGKVVQKHPRHDREKWAQLVVCVSIDKIEDSP